MKRRTTIAALGAVALLSAACGSTPSAEEGATPRTYPQALQDARVAVACRAMLECPESTLLALPTQGRFEDRDACERFYADNPAYLGDVESFEAATAAGRVSVDLDAQRECVRAIDALVDALPACANIGDVYAPECDGVFTGQVAEGDACGLDYECAGVLDCQYGSHGAFPPDEDANCAGRCVEPTCGGEVCAEAEFCKRADDGSYGCSPKLGEGDACVNGDDCTRDGSDVGCFDDAGVCTRYGSIPEGGACPSAGPYCAPGLRCDGGACARYDAYAFGQAGDACQPFDMLCGPGLTCTDLDVTQDPPVGTCGPLRQQGEPCHLLTECDGALHCLGSSVSSPTLSTCEPRLGLGEPCQNLYDCASGLCDGSSCIAFEACLAR